MREMMDFINILASIFNTGRRRSVWQHHASAAKPFANGAPAH